MAASTVRIRGLKELQRDLKRMESELAQEVKDELKEAATIVASEATSRAQRFRGARPAKAVVTGRAAFARTTARSTGRRRDFGSLLMRTAYEPALEAKQSEVIEGLERMLDKLADKNGF